MKKRKLSIDTIEIVLGGIFGIIAVIAAILEMQAIGFSTETILGGVKDIAGTMVAVMVFLIAFRNFASNTPRTLVGKLEKAIKTWAEANFPLLFKVEEFQKEKEGYYEQGFAILQNQHEFLSKSISMADAEKKHYSAYTSKKTGKFADLPGFLTMVKEGFRIRFNFIDSTYGENAADFVVKTCDCINGRYKKQEFKARVIDKRRFTVEIPRITSEEEIEYFIELLDFAKLLLVIQS